MSQLSDLELVKYIQQNGNEESFQELASRHNPLFYKICKNYVDILINKGYQEDDIYKDKDYVIYGAAMSYDFKRKMKVSTWIGSFTRYYCLNLINKNKKNHNYYTFSMDDVNHRFFSLVKGGETEPASYLFDYSQEILQLLGDKRIARIFKLRYFSGGQKTWREIGKNMGMSSQTCINLYNKGLELLKSKFKAENAVDFV